MKRSFPLKTIAYQTTNSLGKNILVLETEFYTSNGKVYFLNGVLENVFKLFINGEEGLYSDGLLSAKQTSDYKLIIEYTLTGTAISKAEITLQFLADQIYDIDEYQPK